MAEAELVQRVNDEIQWIIEALEGLIALPSRWSGVLILDAILPSRDTKPYNCSIILRADLVSSEERWRTLIHEALHCFSTGYNAMDFIAHRGWEEGVVEQLQRLLRPGILAQLGIEIDAALFEAIEADHAFNIYIEALERIRHALGQEAYPFYRGLLATPIKQRYGSLMQQAMQLEAENRTQAIGMLSRYRETLNGRP